MKQKSAFDLIRITLLLATLAVFPAPSDAADSDSFPFTAVLTCGMNGFNNDIVMAACMEGDAPTNLELTNGGQYGLYKDYTFPRNWPATKRGREIPLASHFDLQIQNSSEHMFLGVRIFDKSGKVVFQKLVPQFGVIKVQN